MPVQTQFIDSSRPSASSRGFSLLEMMVSMAILLGVTGMVMSGMLQASKAESTIENRTEMHASVRSATELMQQEIGQAGRIGLPGSVTLGTAVSAGGSATVSVGATAAAQMFVGEYLVVDTGSNQETVTLTAVGTNTFTAIFNNAHLATAPVIALGAFGTGVVPDTVANGSDGSHLKLYGDINGDGNMVFVEYTCTAPVGNTPGALYRSVTTLGAATISAYQVLLPNVLSNPGGTACFTYQEKPTGCSGSGCYVVDVAVTLTVQTQQVDATTGNFQTETKALLNVSPRNVYQVAYELSTNSNNRVEPTPSFVTSLLSQTPQMP